MAKIVAKNAKIFGGGRDVSGRSNTLSLGLSAETPDVTTFGAGTYRERLGDGIKDVELSFAGFSDLSACEVNSTLDDLHGASAWWGTYFSDSSGSKIGREMNGTVTDYAVDGSIEGAVTFSATVGGIAAASIAGSGGGLYDVTALSSSTVQAIGASNDTSVDFAAQTTSGVWNFFRVMTIAGSTPEISACVQESSDDSSFTTITVFTAASSGNQVFSSSAASSLRYRRARVALAASANGVVSPCATFQISSGSVR